MKSILAPIKVEGRMRWLCISRCCGYTTGPRGSKSYTVRGRTVRDCVSALKISLWADHRLRGWKFDVDIQSPGGRRIKFKIPER